MSKKSSAVASTDNPFVSFENFKKSKFERSLHDRVSTYSPRVAHILKRIESRSLYVDPGLQFAVSAAYELLWSLDDLYECPPLLSIALQSDDYVVLRIKKSSMLPILVNRTRPPISDSVLLPFHANAATNTLDILCTVMRLSLIHI